MSRKPCRCGAGPDSQRSYVEPNPVAFARMPDLVRTTRDGLERQGYPANQPAETGEIRRALPEVSLVRLLERTVSALVFFAEMAE